jgi:hypothetical protein
LDVELEALTKQNGVRLFIVKLKKKVKTDLPYLSFYKKKPETHIFFFWPRTNIEVFCKWKIRVEFLYIY